MNMVVIISVGSLLLMVLIYFAGISRGVFNKNQDKIHQIVDRYHKELTQNSHLAEYLYPNLLLNAGILSLEKERDMEKVLKIIEKRHIKSPFITYKDVNLKNVKSVLIEFQKKKNNK